MIKVGNIYYPKTQEGIRLARIARYWQYKALITERDKRSIYSKRRVKITKTQDDKYQR